jgi:hypothetical protein
MNYDFDHEILETKLNSEKFSTKYVNQKSVLLTLNYRHPNPQESHTWRKA